MKALLLTFIFCFGTMESQADTNVLLNKFGTNDVELSKRLTTQKTLKLNDPFLVQLYTSWKARGALDPRVNSWFQSVVDHQFDTSLKSLGDISGRNIQDLKEATELYLLYKLGYHQTFLGKWIDLSSSTNFLKSELGLALDQVVGPQVTNLFLSSGFSLTPDMEKKLTSIEGQESRVNYSFQAFKALRSGSESVKWIGKLDPHDSLRIHLAYTAVLSYAKEGKLGASGTLIKKVIEPWIESRASKEEVAFYYLTLGRLLYQARAFDESISYYKLIPESSKYFLQARTESLWAHLQMRNFSESVGELASLKLGVFSKQFYPEIFLASAIGHTMLCQFSDARKSIHQFVKTNKEWGAKIEASLKADEPILIKESLLTKLAKKQIKNMTREKVAFKNFGIQNYNQDLSKRIAFAGLMRKTAAARGWKNRYSILDSALYKMKFVRIELLSRVKAVKDGLSNKIVGRDEVKLHQAARLKSNEISFPNDGMLWGDELFHMTADVVNECIQGKFYGK